jgi:hypothetical protein
MTTPPFDPSGRARDPDASPTEPVAAPRFEPAPPDGAATSQAAFAPPPAGAPPAAAPTFQPVTPEPVAPLGPPPAARRSTGSSRVLNVALAVAVLVATAGVAFALGRTTAPASATTAGRFNGGVGGFGPNASFAPNGNEGLRGDGGFVGRGGFGALGGGLSIQGTVESVSADSITITTQDGQSITIGLDSSTTYHQQSAASASDVQAGKTVILDVTGGFRPGVNGNGNSGSNGNAGNGGFSLGTASDVTVVP